MIYLIHSEDRLNNFSVKIRLRNLKEEKTELLGKNFGSPLMEMLLGLAQIPHESKFGWSLCLEEPRSPQIF